MKEIGVLEQMRREGIYMQEPCEMPPYRRNDWAYVALVWCGLGALAAMCAYGAVLMVRFVWGVDVSDGFTASLWLVLCMKRGEYNHE